MIPDNSRKKLEQLRQEAALRAQLTQQYDKEMAAKYTRDMPSFTEWMAQRQPKATGGKVEPDQDTMRLALTKRHGMYSPLEKAAIDIPRAKGTGAEFMAEISKRPGFKAEEIADRKIPIPEGKMTKAEFLKHLQSHSLPPLTEHVLDSYGDEDEALDFAADNLYGKSYSELMGNRQARQKVEDWVEKNSTKYNDYQLGGAKNYREMLLKLPSFSESDEHRIMELEADKRRASYPDFWGKDTGLAKELENLKQRKASMGNQYHSSHWKDHPNVLAHMRLSDRTGPKGEKLLHLEELQSDWHQAGRKHGYTDPSERQHIVDKLARNEELTSAEEEARLRHLGGKGVPNAPFKKSWHEHALKHALHHAAKHGYHGLVITPGHEQAKRYDLSKHINDLQYDPKTKTLAAWDHSGNKVVDKYGVEEDQLSDYVGKEGATKLLAQNPKDSHVKQLFGADLQVGGEGMKGFYDKMLPTYLNKLGKPHGVQVGQMPVAINSGMHVPNPAGGWTTTPPETKQLHHFPITEPMRTSILKEGMPQYMRGGVVHKAEGGAVLPIEEIKAQMMNRFKGLSSLQSIGANEAPSLGIKAYVPTAGSPDNNRMPVGGIDTSQGALPVGGIDMSKMQPGQQLMPTPAGQQPGMDQVPMGDKIPTMDGTGMPPNPNANPNQMGSNILSMTPQGQAMAAMKPQGLAKGGAVNMARGGMPFAIKAPQELPKAPSEFTPYDDTKPSIPTLSKAFDEAIAHHLSLSPEDRMINSQRAAMQVAQHTGMTSSGKPKDLLGQNEKLLKSGKGIEGQEPVKLPDGRGVETTGLALAPAYEEGNFNTCPNHHSCKAECLGKTSGNYFKLGGGQDLSEFKGPRLNSLLKTNAFLRDPHALAVKLYDEIDSAKQMAAANGNHLGVRLNVLSDINPRVHKAIIEAHPDVTFYDYTKNNTNPIAPNHHYTYSSTGVSQPGVENKHTNWKQMRRRLDQGDNVAMAFSHKDHLPEVVHDQETGKKYKVIDGDTHDFRPLDLVGEGEDGVIVGLKNKKATGKMDEAHIDSKGFFLHYDPQLKMSTNAKGQPVYARTASNRISEKTGKPMLGETIPQNRTVNIQPQTRGMIPLTNDGEKQ